MLGFEHDPDTAWLHVFLQPARRLPGEPFLNLQPGREQVNHTGQLGESEDPLSGKVGDVRDAVKWQQVMFAEGAEGMLRAITSSS